MFKRISMIALLFVSSLAVDLPEAEAGGRRGVFFRRNRQTRTYRSNQVSISKKTNAPQSTKLHQTHSRSAILDGFFGPYPGGQGHDRSWYVGK